MRLENYFIARAICVRRPTAWVWKCTILDVHTQKIKKIECVAAGATAYEANGAVQEGLRHARFSTTKRYLYGRKIITKKKIKTVDKKIPKNPRSQQKRFEPSRNVVFIIMNS